jgi:hypothetical protein
MTFCLPAVSTSPTASLTADNFHIHVTEMHAQLQLSQSNYTHLSLANTFKLRHSSWAY